MDGAQIGVDIFVGSGENKAVMAKNVYQLAQYLDSDFIWYEDAYMKKVVHRGQESINHIFEYLKDKVMEDEIFGPILPILTYKNIEEVISTLSTIEMGDESVNISQGIQHNR